MEARTPKTRLATKRRPIPAQVPILFITPSSHMSGLPDTADGNKTESHLRGRVDTAAWF
jgi:hypothetical protein